MPHYRLLLLTTLSLIPLVLSLSLFAETINEMASLEVIEVIAEKNQKISYRNHKTVNDISHLLALNIDKIEDVAAYTSSVFASTANAGMETGLMIRGFTTGRQNIYVNGHLDNQRMFMRSPETVEQVLIEKGHASIFYGGAAPGGTLIYHTKKPQDEAQTQLTATLGSYDKYKLALDTSGLITDSLNYRAVLVKQKANSFIENAKDDKKTLYTHLGWQISAKQQLAVEVEYNKLTNPWTFGLVRLNDDIGDRILYDKSYVYPTTNSNREYLRTSIYWHYLLGENSKLTIKLNQVDLDRDDIWMGFYYKLASNNLVGYWADIDNKAKQHNAVINVEHRLDTTWARHNINIGYNYNQYQNTQQMDRSIGKFIIDPYAPDYSIAEPADINSIRAFSSDETESSIYLIDTMDFNNNLQLSVGLRGSAFKIVDRTNNSTSVDKKALTSFIGVVYQVNDNVKLYSNFSQSYEPNIGLDKNQQYFEPKKANQIELAAEYALNQQHSVSVAIYQIKQTNLLTRDPDDPDFQILAGSIQSKGLEVSFINNLTEQWQLKNSISHMKNQVDNSLSTNHGNSAANIPRNSFSSQIHWQHPYGDLGAHIGVLALSSRYGDNANSFTLPGYARVDLGSYFKVDAWQFNLYIENLLNKRYIITSNYDDDMYPGRPIDIRLSASYQW